MIDKVQKIREAVEKLKSQLLRGACSSQVAMETRCKEEAYNEVLAILDTMQEEPVSGIDYGNMPIERWKQAVKAASNQRSYRSSKGLTETKDDYFVDGVLWADEHPKEEPVSEELEEASLEYFKQALKDGDKTKLDAFKAGAKWQKEQDESTTKDLGDYINKLSKQFPEVSFAKLSRIAVRVAKWQKQQDKETIEVAEDHAMLAGMEKMKEQMMAKAIDGEVTYGKSLAIPSLGFVLDKEGLDFGHKVKVIVIKED